VELVEIELVPTQALHGAEKLLPGSRAVPLLGLAADKQFGLRVAAQVIAQADFSVGVAGRDIDVIDASSDCGFDQAVGVSLIQDTGGIRSERDD
jgi:hypothetical protein